MVNKKDMDPIFTGLSLLKESDMANTKHINTNSDEPCGAQLHNAMRESYEVY